MTIPGNVFIIVAIVIALVFVIAVVLPAIHVANKCLDEHHAILVALISSGYEVKRVHVRPHLKWPHRKGTQWLERRRTADIRTTPGTPRLKVVLLGETWTPMFNSGITIVPVHSPSHLEQLVAQSNRATN